MVKRLLAQLEGKNRIGGDLTHPRLLIGSNSKTIATVDFNQSENTLRLVETKEVGYRPSWIHHHKSDTVDVLLTNNEADIGRVLVYDITVSGTPFSDFTLDSLLLRFNEESGGADPCHMSVSLDGKWLFVANYNGGTVSVRSLKDGKHSHILDFQSFGETPHPHMMIMNPFESSESKRVYVPDLGSDCLHLVQVDSETGMPSITESLKFTNGSGPRHIAFHPNGSIAYVNLELSSELAVVSLFPSPIILSVHSLLPPGITREAEMQSAAIELSPDSKFIYLSNRKDPSQNDTIVAFKLMDVEGLVDEGYKPEWTKTDGFFPRGFKISPNGEHLCVGNQETDSLVMFKRGVMDGKLVKIAELNLEMGFKPTCVVWV
ncbi:UNVERIFIED_CONTAM: hypothetical protein HDU68_000409 [Siphonaria sp. JEL0065]|nr:hypothetical protein HDU68_000409 [Siphonaria sp. JEL0065]